MKLIFISFALLISSTAFADWGGVLSGDGQTQKSTYENCDMNVDFYLDRPKNKFEVAHIDYSCAMPNGPTLYQAFNDIQMTIDGVNGTLLHNGAVVGTMTDTSLEFVLQQGAGAHFQFEVVPGTAAWDAVIIDGQNGTPIKIRLW